MIDSVVVGFGGWCRLRCGLFVEVMVELEFELVALENDDGNFRGLHEIFRVFCEMFAEHVQCYEHFYRSF